MRLKLAERNNICSLEVNVQNQNICVLGDHNRINIQWIENRTRVGHKYLGIIITNDGTLGGAIVEKNMKGTKAILMLNDVTCYAIKQ